MENTNFTNEDINAGDYVETDSEKGTITITIPENPFVMSFILTSLLISDIEAKKEFFDKRVAEAIIGGSIKFLISETDANYELIRKQQ